MNILFKFLFYLKKPKLVVVLGDDSSKIIELISKAFRNNITSEKIDSLTMGCNFLKILKHEAVIIKGDIKNKKEISEISFLAKEASFFSLVLCCEFNGNEVKRIKNLLRGSNNNKALISEAQIINKIGTNQTINYGVGFDKKSDIYISDLKIDEETNFKISNKGNIVPFWFNKNLTRKEIVLFSLAVGVAMSLGLNLVQISQNLKTEN